MVNQSKKNDERFWRKWKSSGAIGTINSPDYGRAFAFFNCNASEDAISKEILNIMGAVNTPKTLELHLSNYANNPFPGISDPNLLEVYQSAKESGMQYLLEARARPNLTNRQTADELSAILNQAYQSPLYRDGEEFAGGIVYKDRNGYTFRE